MVNGDGDDVAMVTAMVTVVGDDVASRESSHGAHIPR
jgi:hypothetical protein